MTIKKHVKNVKQANVKKGNVVRVVAAPKVMPVVKRRTRKKQNVAWRKVVSLVSVVRMTPDFL